MRVDVLGPLRVTCGDTPIAPARPKERALLAALALSLDRPVPLEALAAALWGEHPPATADRTLQSHVAHLRHDLGSQVIARDPGGYRLMLSPRDVDAVELETLVAAGQSAWREGNPALARTWFRRAEALWRGEPLQDLADTPDREAHIERLRDLWWRAREGWIRAELELGHHHEVLAALQSLVSEQPLRESSWALLILALYRSGNQVDALRTYRRLRTMLADELGTEPSPQLQRLQAQVLRQDPQLDVQPPPPPFVVPTPTSSFVGRAGQAEAIAAALAASRLVTLHGPAGVGKSRLAQQTARHVRSRFTDGVWWVDLAACTDGEEVVDQIAATLGVTASAGLGVGQSLAGHLRMRDLLLVLDNCEHVARPLAPQLVSLLGAAARLHVLATSRVLLQVSGEVRWEVPPLAVPALGSDHGAIASSDAVELFQQRLGRAVDEPGGLRLAADIVRALDGLPLAVELVAVRAQHLSLAEVADQLASQIAQARRAAASPAHHSDVQATIAWSYARLDPDAQRLFAWLSVFPAEFDRGAMEAVAAAIPGTDASSIGPRLDQLLDASMVAVRMAGDTTRYRMLFVMREFASTRLDERGEAYAASRAFADHYRSLAVSAAAELNGDHPGTWLNRLRRDLANLRTALEWSRRNEPPTRSLAFVPALGRVMWPASVDLAADAALLRAVIADAGDGHPDARAWALQASVTTTYLSGDLPGALAACERATALFTEAGDRAGLAAAHWHWGATLLLAAGDLPAADRILRRGRALAREAGVATVEAWTLAHLVQLAYFAGTVSSETLRFHATAESLADPEDEVIQAHLAMNRAGLQIARGKMESAVDAARHCERFARGVGISVYEQAGLLLLGTSLISVGRTEEARATALRAARIALDAGNHMQLGLALQQLARIAEEDDPSTAACLWGAATLRGPVMPAFEPVLFPARAADVLAERFDVEVAAGRTLPAEATIDLAIG